MRETVMMDEYKHDVGSSTYNNIIQYMPRDRCSRHTRTHGTARHALNTFIHTHTTRGSHRSARPLPTTRSLHYTYSPCTIDISDLPIPFVSRGTLILAFVDVMNMSKICCVRVVVRGVSREEGRGNIHITYTMNISVCGEIFNRINSRGSLYI